MGYNDGRRPSAKAIVKENEGMLARQAQFRTAAEYVAAAFAEVPAVRRVALFGSVASPLAEEIPAYGRFRMHRMPVLHECKDVDLAVWLEDYGCLKAIQKARGQALNYLYGLRQIGVAHHQVDVFIIDAATGDYAGNLCCFGTCPKGKEDCWVSGCGDTPFLKKYERFTFHKDAALSPAKSVVLFDRDKHEPESTVSVDGSSLPTSNLRPRPSSSEG
jgi:hypothetical protein